MTELEMEVLSSPRVFSSKTEIDIIFCPVAVSFATYESHTLVNNKLSVFISSSLATLLVDTRFPAG